MSKQFCSLAAWEGPTELLWQDRYILILIYGMFDDFFMGVFLEGLSYSRSADLGDVRCLLYVARGFLMIFGKMVNVGPNTSLPYVTYLNCISMD